MTSASLLTVEDVRERLNVGKTTVWQLIWSGELPSLKIGRAVRIRETDLDAFIELRIAESDHVGVSR